MLYFYVLLCVLGLLRPKSKVLFILMVLLCWVLFSFNTYNGDFEDYLYIYERITEPGFLSFFEYGFSFIMLICRKAGFSFIHFRIVIATIFILFLVKAIIQNTNRIALVMALVMVFPFLSYISVLRSGLASILLTNGFFCLYKGGKKNKVKYVLYVVFASLFHYSTLFFLILVYLDKPINKKWLFVFIVGIGIYLVLFKTGVLYNVMSRITNRQKILKYFSKDLSENLNWKGSLSVIAVFLINWLLSFYMMKNYYGKKDYRLMSQKDYNFNTMVLLMMPISLFSTVYLRFSYEVMIINAIVFVNMDCMKTNRTIKINCRKLPIISVVAVWYILVLIYANWPYMNTPESCWLSFYNNLLLQ